VTLDGLVNVVLVDPAPAGFVAGGLRMPLPLSSQTINEPLVQGQEVLFAERLNVT
jgi:hypothetical protein